jgi:hypothetical protein
VTRTAIILDSATVTGGVPPATPAGVRAARTTSAPVKIAMHRTWRRLAQLLVLGGHTAFALWGLADGAYAAAVVKAAIRRNGLTVSGTTGPDAVTLRLEAGDPTMLEIDVGADGTADYRFDRRLLTAIVVSGRTGDEIIIADHRNGLFSDTESTTFGGGDGNDTLIGAHGAERLIGGSGDDVVDGNQGADLILLGDGADLVMWDPGDGSDVVNGGPAVVVQGLTATVRIARAEPTLDRLTVNGLEGNDTITATPAAHALILLDLAP